MAPTYVAVVTYILPLHLGQGCIYKGSHPGKLLVVLGLSEFYK